MVWGIIYWNIRGKVLGLSFSIVQRSLKATVTTRVGTIYMGGNESLFWDFKVLEGHSLDNDFSSNANHIGLSASALIRLLFCYCHVMSLNDCSDWQAKNRERAIWCELIVVNVYLHFRTFSYNERLKQILFWSHFTSQRKLKATIWRWSSSNPNDNIGH